MKSPSRAHFTRTAKLAKALKRPDVYEWLVTKGYFPEAGAFLSLPANLQAKLHK